MATAEQTSESTAGETRRVVPMPFLTKTYQLVDDPSVDHLISWNEDGSGFIIWRPVEFARDLLPKYFKHSNLSSFVRQLNTYGFRKVVPERWEFVNHCFKKGEKGLLLDIQRRKLTRFAVLSSVVTTSTTASPTTVQLMNISTSNSGEDQMFSSTSSPGGTPDLVEENERLKKENEQMTNELTHLRGLCNNIFQLMSSYGPSSSQQDTKNPSMESKELDFLQSGMFSSEQGGSSSGRVYEGETYDNAYQQHRTSPKLFGVSIGAKRARSEDNESVQEHRTEHECSKAQSEMKLEQSHSGTS